MKVATYNIMHGFHGDMLLVNVASLIAQGVDVLCLQEYEAPFSEALNAFLPSLPGRWGIEQAHVGTRGDLGIMWNTDKLKLREARIVLLPCLPRPSVSQRIQGRTAQRRRAALSCTFAGEDHTVRITTVQLAWEGGIRQRLRQLRHLKRELAAGDAVDSDIVCGDFNTVPPRLWQRWQQQKLQDVLGAEYVDASPQVQWTYDNAYFTPYDGIEALTRICRSVGMTWRSRLDYIFVRGFAVISGNMVNLPGADHRPVVAELGRTIL